MANWTPTTDQEKQLRDALFNLKNSTDPATLKPPVHGPNPVADDQQKLFILQSEGFFALKAYVMSGKDFPTTDAQFDKEIPEACFRVLKEVDKDIYSQTKTGLVKIGSTCTDFYNQTLYRIVGAGTIAVTWSKKTLGYLHVSEDFNLYQQLMVLLDTKYKRPEDYDQAWTDAFNEAKFTLEQLIEEANNSKKEADALVVALLKFRDTTSKSVLPHVNTLVDKYSEKGDVGTHNKPYLNYLNEDVAKSTTKMIETLGKYNHTYKDWKIATGVAVGVGVTIGWLPLFGWIPLAFAAHNADKLHTAYQELWNSYNDLININRDAATLIKWVQTMVVQLKDVDKKITTAIDGIKDLSTMFEEQSKSYILIRDSLGGIKTGISQDDAKIRKKFVEGKMKETIKEITDLQAAAEGFIKAILNDKTENIFGLSK